MRFNHNTLLTSNNITSTQKYWDNTCFHVSLGHEKVTSHTSHINADHSNPEAFRLAMCPYILWDQDKLSHTCHVGPHHSNKGVLQPKLHSSFVQIWTSIIKRFSHQIRWQQHRKIWIRLVFMYYWELRISTHIFLTSDIITSEQKHCEDTYVHLLLKYEYR